RRLQVMPRRLSARRPVVKNGAFAFYLDLIVEELYDDGAAGEQSLNLRVGHVRFERAHLFGIQRAQVLQKLSIALYQVLPFLQSVIEPESSCMIDHPDTPFRVDHEVLQIAVGVVNEL